MEQSSSPGTNPVELSNSIEELLKFTLQSHLNGTLELDIGLSKQFCSSLLNHPSTSPISLNASSSSEASQNPLYKQLARALYEIITFGSLQESSDCNKVASFCQGSDLKQKDEWFDLVHKEGSELAEDVHYYASFFEMLEAESLAKVLPGVKTIDEGNNPVILSRGGVQVYRKFYTEEKEKTNGVVAICVAKMAAQPYLSLARIL
ncbi:hypothetical protein Gogos_010145, partial [Gossypium gossypioides]|nr:hypothetical protein [Gossypium gossypioides]